MNLAYLRYFEAVCRCRSITRAAAELHLSQPSLSGAVKKLEDEFGVSLLLRLPSGVSPTPEGEVLLAQSAGLLEQADRLTEKMRALRGEPTVKIGVPPMLSSLVFPRLFGAFCARCPGFRLELMEHGTLTNLEMLQKGAQDAAIVSCEGPLTASFTGLDLCRLNIFFYISAGHPLAGQRAVSLADAGGTPLVLLAEDSFLTNFLRQRFAAAGLAPTVAVSTNQLETIHRLVSSGGAAAFLFDGILPAKNGIVKLPVPALGPVQIRLVWAAQRRLSPAARALVRVAREEYRF